MIKLDKMILMATIGKTHGLKGEVYINSYANNPMELSRYSLYSNYNREIKILKMYRQKERLIVALDGIDDVNSASNLRNLKLYAKRKDFKDEELEDDEFFNADLEEMETFDLQGRYYGKVCAIYNFGAGSMLEIKNSADKTYMIPFNKCAILNVDIQNNKILIDKIAAGVDNIDENHDCPPESIEGIS
ncbi:ribosome maturation factor RimM [Candidatus Liberibacter brunswickensis]|uniref:ribosome maturation factor RimM n=1 Tax=Candidatus Liberibacter brunswickensis TaxID=1968796 RepID=UPI002FE183DE